MKSRLESVFEELAIDFRNAQPDRRSYVVRSACLEALNGSGLTGEIIERAIAALKSGTSISDHEIEIIEELAAKHDSEYFRLKAEHGSISETALKEFKRARAAMALCFAFSNDEAKQEESLYESLSISSDQNDAAAAAIRRLSNRIN